MAPDTQAPSARNAVDLYVAERALGEGDRLPPERELAAELGISRRALRQLLTQMELEGQVWRGRRNGTFLGRRANDAVGVDRRMGLASPDSVLEARLAVEPAVAALAAMKAGEADLATIANCARRTSEVVDDEAWVRWDGAFHLAIAEATRNDILVGLVTGFNAARAAGAWKARRIAAMTAEKRRLSAAHHRAICDMLKKRSPEEAGRAMRQHLLSVQTNMFD